VANYIDDKGKKIEKGFYKEKTFGVFVYFTGKYDKGTGYPIFEKENEIGKTKLFPLHTVRELYKLNDDEIKVKLNDLKLKDKKEEAGWLEKKLKEDVKINPDEEFN
jgi:hypothetical protein